MSRGIYDKVNKVRIPTCGKEAFEIDNAMSSTSQNAVQNRVIYTEFNNLREEIASSITISGEEMIFSFGSNS